MWCRRETEICRNHAETVGERRHPEQHTSQVKSLFIYRARFQQPQLTKVPHRPETH